MYKNKGHIKVFNGSKFKIVSYLNEDNLITFTTSKNSNKYKEFIKENKLIAKENNSDVERNIKIIENEKEIDVLFNKLKETKAIPFFIPRKNKIIVQYTI